MSRDMRPGGPAFDAAQIELADPVSHLRLVLAHRKDQAALKHPVGAGDRHGVAIAELEPRGQLPANGNLLSARSRPAPGVSAAEQGHRLWAIVEHPQLAIVSRRRIEPARHGDDHCGRAATDPGDTEHYGCDERDPVLPRARPPLPEQVTRRYRRPSRIRTPPGRWRPARRRRRPTGGSDPPVPRHQTNLPDTGASAAPTLETSPQMRVPYRGARWPGWPR
jgi:hypothetical protein